MIRVKLDHAQTRVLKHRRYIKVNGLYQADQWNLKRPSGWSSVYGSKDASGTFETLACPVTGMLMLRPAPFSPLWETTSTGIFLRLKKADYTLTTPTQWKDENKNGSASSFLSCQEGTLSEEVRTSATWDKNRGFMVGVFGQSWGGNSGEPVFRAGWGSTSEGVYVELALNGTCTIYKDGEQVSAPLQVIPSGFDRQFVKLLLIPCRGRDLLILSSEDFGAIHSFGDIDEDDEDPTITPADNFFWQVLEGKAEVECAPLRYPSSANRASILCHFSGAPYTGTVPTTTLWSDLPGYGTQSASIALRNSADAASFTPNSTATDARLRISFTSDGESTPFVYGGDAEFEPVLGQTDGSEEMDPTEDFLVGLSLDVDESPGGTTWQMEFKNVSAIEEITPRKLSIVSRRPIAVDLNQTVDADETSIRILDGVGGCPKYTDHFNDEARRLIIDVGDKWRLLQAYRFKDPTVLDGRSVAAAFASIAKAAGFASSELDIGTIGGLSVRQGPEISLGEFRFLIGKKSDDITGEDVMLKLHETYAPEHFMGVRPTVSGPKLTIKTSAELGEDVQFRLFATIADAKTYLQDTYGYDPNDAGDAEELRRLAPRYVYRTYNDEAISAEGNQIWVQGRDPRTGRPILAFKNDLPSQDITLAPSARPDNWRGELAMVGVDGAPFTTSTQCVDACELLALRLFPVRFIAEFWAEFMVKDDGVPIWKGDVVSLGDHGYYRIIALSTQRFKEYNEDTFDEETPGRDNWQWRPTRYVAEFLPEGRTDSRGVGYTRGMGTGLASIASAAQFWSENAGRFSSDPVTSRPAIIQVQL